MKLRHALPLAVVFCTLGWQNAMAQSDIGFKAAGVKAGLVNVENIDATFGFGVFADLGTITPDIGLESYLDYWSHSESTYGGGEASVRDIVLGARGKYFFPTANPNLRPFAGTGLGLHFVTAEVSIPDQYIGGFLIPGMSVSDSETKLGLDLGGGLATRINDRTDFIAEMWYSVVTDVGQLGIKAGISHRFGM